MIQVYSLKTNVDGHNWSPEELLNILTPKRKAKALRFRHSRDQWQGIMAGLLEEFTIQQHFGIPWPEQQIQTGINGKPYIENRPELHYNLSHSGNWVVCGAGEIPVGIDVECSDKYSERVVKRFFHKDEIADIMEHDVMQRPDIFAEYWTMKESFMKLSGLGFELQLKQFVTDRKSGEAQLLETAMDGLPEEIRTVIDTLPLTKQAVCQFIPLEAGYRLAVCTQQKEILKYENVPLENCVETLLKSSRHQNE